MLIDDCVQFVEIFDLSSITIACTYTSIDNYARIYRAYRTVIYILQHEMQKGTIDRFCNSATSAQP